jgi:flagella basal body P-ring formation protein FlgA
MTTMLANPANLLRRCRPLVMLLAASVAACGGMVQGADVQLKPKANVQGSLVRLADVADVLDSDANRTARLTQIELCPAPLPGQELKLTAADIQRSLLHRGVELSTVRFSGAGYVVVASGDSGSLSQAQPRRAGSLSASSVRQANDRVVEAIAAYLRQAVPGEQPWDIALHCNSAAQRRLAQATHVQVMGTAQPQETMLASYNGTAPTGTASATPGTVEGWLGPQTFVLSLEVEGRREKLTVPATVSLTPGVVVVTVPVSKGTVLQAEHLKVQRGAKAAAADAFHRIDEVIGKQATMNMAAGQIIDEGMVQEPQLVQRGEIVTVNVYSSGVRLRMEARAREAGRRGDTIVVEGLNDRRLFQARVCGLQTVEVLARGTSLAGRSDAP